MAAGPRARLIEHTISTVQEHGVHAAALSELLKRSRASRNSLYQHFPSGKGELVQTAARIVARLVYSHVSSMADALQTAPSAQQWLTDLLAFWRIPLEKSDYAAGSFMMAAALDELDPAVQSIAGQAFAEWTARLAVHVRAHRASRSVARAGARRASRWNERDRGRRRRALVHDRGRGSTTPRPWQIPVDARLDPARGLCTVLRGDRRLGRP